MNANKTILVIDDEPAIREIVGYMLRKADFEVCAAGDLEEARRWLGFGSGVDAVLSDYDLPDGTGLDLLAWLRSHNGENMPVVIMSGAWYPACSEVSLSEFEFLPKPFLSVHLFSALDRAFQNAPQPAWRRAVSAAPAQASNHASPL